MQILKAKISVEINGKTYSSEASATENVVAIGAFPGALDQSFNKIVSDIIAAKEVPATGETWHGTSRKIFGPLQVFGDVSIEKNAYVTAHGNLEVKGCLTMERHEDRPVYKGKVLRTKMELLKALLS